ncbi:MAG: cytochrome c biogenesis protein CcdA [Tissierellaceae bacterium]|nr:cytochrome c biogenesis protein CcdA [Tissierellaceae bacterium]
MNIVNLIDVSIPIAFLAGFISFFSPCILPLIPAYIMYITGINIEEDLSKKRLFTLNRTLFFVLGFTIIFMIMGTSASFLGKVFINNKNLFSKISGIIIIIFGLNMMGILKIRFLNIERRIKAPKITSGLSSILMGMAFAAGWTPCFGPTLGAILMFAGGVDTVSKGVFLLLIYSIGMGIPFILTALSINVFTKFLSKADRFLKYVPIISGLIMVIFGLLIYFGKLGLIGNLFI